MGFRNPLTALSQLVADIVTGALLRTAETGNRVEIYSEPGGGFGGVDEGRVDFHTGGGELAPGRILGGFIGDRYDLLLESPTTAGGDSASITLEAEDAPAKSRLNLSATDINIGDADNGETVLFGNRGSRFTALDFGYFSGNTDGSGDVNVPHTLGVAPAVVLAHSPHAGQPWVPWNQKASNTGAVIPFRMRRADTNAIAGGGTAVEFFWLAIRG